MKKWLIIMATFSFLATSTSGIAAQAEKKGPSDRAYEQANDKASFKREETPSRKQGKKPDKEKVGKDADEKTSAETKGQKKEKGEETKGKGKGKNKT